ncbi:hypothetical protein IVB38_06835 [Bradyrhizobium sp. 38]|uniref:hypothetical protein n=1 Tax=unclassified Bradyrhizobium TaxID=2631580 RepID=UPI001FF98BD3|nr:MULTISPECIES: hypothetical protein [unclassified Bradyrhizobium]MCK1335755.1 hypothetical protein [Bradyrhizobium sp. 38]MCK1776951.1 hypothetical protein [Bradyrhizobium sp. 132]
MAKARKKAAKKSVAKKKAAKKGSSAKRRAVTRKKPAKKKRALGLRGASRFVAVAAGLDKETCAGHVFGETSVLSNNAAKLAEARRFIAGVAYKRNGTGMAPAKIPTEDELKNPNTKAIWDRCLQAAGDAAGDDVGTCKHFVVWFSDDDGKTPSKQPSRITDDWPYDQADKIKGSWGPFVSPVTPKGNNIFVIKYCGVP